MFSLKTTSRVLIIMFFSITGIIYGIKLNKPDNILEEIAEELIEAELGIPARSIDFTPHNK